MTAFESDRAKLTNALDSNPSLHNNQSLINEALNLHFSNDIGPSPTGAVNHFANEMNNDPKGWAQLHMGLEAVADAAVKAHDNQFAASIYRDLVIMDQGAAVAMIAGKDTSSAGVMLGRVGDIADPYNAGNAMNTIRALDPGNKDLPTLHKNQGLLVDDLEGIERQQSGNKQGKAGDTSLVTQAAEQAVKPATIGNLLQHN